jgi:hypothetical protein
LHKSKIRVRATQQSTASILTVPAEVALFSQRTQREVVLGVGAGGYVQIPLDLLAVEHLQAVYGLQGELRIDLRELAVPGATTRTNGETGKI